MYVTVSLSALLAVEVDETDEEASEGRPEGNGQFKGFRWGESTGGCLRCSLVRGTWRSA